MLEIVESYSEKAIQKAREIFEEYVAYLGIDLDFQNFERELVNLPGEYQPPHGCILLAFFNKNIVGCVALRKLERTICEMKRLYVKPNYRGKEIGKNLAKLIIDKTTKIGYKYMRLDTLHFMKEALSLYESLGFKEIEPYRYNPFKGAKFFELEL